MRVPCYYEDAYTYLKGGDRSQPTYTHRMSHELSGQVGPVGGVFDNRDTNTATFSSRPVQR